jgi:periplasmic divalent cation tolerance protein
MSELLIGWTTLETENDARRLAHELVERKLAVCIQIEGPIHSVYRWEGRVTEAEEWRLMVKHLPGVSQDLSAFLQTAHPYTNPEWVVVAADYIAPMYLEWAQSNN